MELNSVSNVKSTKTSMDNTNNNRLITPDSSPTKQKKRNESKSPIRKTEKSNKKRIKWAKNEREIIDVVSYKKYNLENCHDDPNIIKDKTRCSCNIF